MEFDARAGLTRIAARVPALASEERIQSLIARDHGEMDDAVLILVSELLIQPSTTLVVASSFRPVLSEVISRIVQSTKQLFESSGWHRHFPTHENVCLALSKVLELSPSMLSLVLQYFAFAPPPFQRFFCGNVDLNGAEVPLLATYSFLRLEPKEFRDLWDWRSLLSLVKPSSASTDLRWCVAQILTVVFRLSDAAARDLLSVSGIPEEEAFSCLIRWEELSQEVAIEKAGPFVDYDRPMPPTDVVSNARVDSQSAVRWKSNADLKISHVQICGIELPFVGETARLHETYVITRSVKAYLEAIALAVSQTQPVLVEGPVGSGKTSLINHVAQLTGNNILFIHLDDQMDTKALLGNYVSTEVPGEFRWQPGTLTQALAQGFWVVFEDIDKAPAEIFSALVSLLEDRKLQIPGRGETIYAAEMFRVFATVGRTKSGPMANTGEGRESFFYLWRKVDIHAPFDDELAVIIENRFPRLAFVAERVLGTFNVVRDIASHTHLGRQYTMRDLLKFCKRIAGYVAGSSEFLLDSIRTRIYWEAVDCFAGSINNSVDCQLVMRSIADQWNVPFKDIVHFPITYPVDQELKPTNARVFAATGHTMRLMERLARCVEQREAVLLVGETGTGKTMLVQRLAARMSMPLTVVNMSQQSDAADFLGGFKPVEAQGFCLPLLETFTSLFKNTFSLQENEEYWKILNRLVEKKKWKQLLKAFHLAVSQTSKLVNSSKAELTAEERVSKRQKSISEAVLDKWRAFSTDLSRAEKQVDAAENAFAFSFVEGALVKALKTGSWLLLDEINLAPAEILERLNGVFDGEAGSICLTERGDLSSIERHPNFRIFACVNPATDVGKRDLPLVLRNKFTEIFVADMNSREDLELLVKAYLEGLIPISPDNKFLGSEVGPEDIVDFYQRARQEADEKITDSAGQKPQFSLRSLSRVLQFTALALRTNGLRRALFDGACMFFLTLLDQPSRRVMEQLIVEVLFKRKGVAFQTFSRSLLKGAARPGGGDDVFIGDFEDEEEYVITETINEHLKNLSRAVYIRKYPVLLQGPTSSGKTSLVEYLARRTGHRFVRINNHEHTDLQEYLGCYVADEKGKLKFKEGLLVEAVRCGYWVVLDELNLAPSDVLEALNRLLDDNRELFVPEIQTTIKPHPDFMLFATQNPPGIYGGRKVLSRAFRNRFIELHIDDIPTTELCKILERRCKLPRRHAEAMVGVMKDLQLHRQGTKAFAGKHGFITPRDLFRWGKRHSRSGVSYDDLARFGYILLGERVRNDREKLVVQSALESNMRVKLEPESFPELVASRDQSKMSETDLCVYKLLEAAKHIPGIVWTKSLKRLFYLAAECYAHKDPILLIGETGCGKTTVCQLLAQAAGKKLYIINCHQHTETSDFLGGFRPVRREAIALEYQAEIATLMRLRCLENKLLSTNIEDLRSALTTLTLVLESKDVQDRDSILLSKKKLLQLEKQWQALFTWQDGPLVSAMRDGDLVLVDEISLAEDSVLERLNSILEPKRSLVLAENGGSEEKEIIARPGFRLIATMNPGGDFGKKELSPALRNRFTEVWVPPIHDLDDIKKIVSERLVDPDFACLLEPLLRFWQWFQRSHDLGKCLSVRDLLSWTEYIEKAAPRIGKYAAFVHGAYLILLDGLGLGSGVSSAGASSMKDSCIDYLLSLIPQEGQEEAVQARFLDSGKLQGNRSTNSNSATANHFGTHPFYVFRGRNAAAAPMFEFTAPTTGRNVMRLLRALQLPKPVLLEGSPGVGKTSLVMALAAASGNPIVRINLSEQTDILDLFGSDLPVEGGKAGEFQWSDGIFLQALKSGSWVLLDELNLASQSVLEGLNACLDHRREVFIPELGQVFKCPTSFQIFACQNPLHEGGGRKGLPKSFLNRFSKVFVEPLSSEDYGFIARAMHPSISEGSLSQMVHFNSQLHYEITVQHVFGHFGSPWELNLRDILRWCSLIEGTRGSFKTQSDLLAYFVDLLYLQRLRTQQDRSAASNIFRRVFGMLPPELSFPRVVISPNKLLVGLAKLERRKYIVGKDTSKQLQLLPGLGGVLESVMHCVNNGWMVMLVGPSKSGKTSTVRLLADLTGNRLREYSLSRATDTSELLGCYEQHDTLRCWREAVVAVNQSAEALCSFLLSDAALSLPVETRIKSVNDILSRWTIFKESQNDGAHGSTSEKLAVNLLSQLAEQLKLSVSSVQTSVDFGLAKLGRLVKVLQNPPTSKAGRFEWVDGDLLRAVESGDWVLLENANLCNPTVLDRLNPLLEPRGQIVISERGLVNGQAMLVQAHPSFRLFLTLDPSNGELSRAMRNRGVEIFMLQPDKQPMNDVPEVYQDVGTLLRLSGIPGLPLVEVMCKVHLELNSLLVKFHASTMSYRELSQWVGLLQLLLERGESFQRSIAYSWEQSYMPLFSNQELQQKARSIFYDQFQQLHLRSDASFYVPGGWPYPLVLREYTARSRESLAKRDCGYVSYLASKLLSFEILKQGYGMLKSQAEKSDLLNWLAGMKSLAAHFPHRLLHYFRNPDSELELSVEGLDSRKMEKLVLYAVLWMLEQAPGLDFEVRRKWSEVFLGTLASRYDTIHNLQSTLLLEKQHQVAVQLKLSWNRLLELTGVEARDELMLSSTSSILNFGSFYSEAGGDLQAAWSMLVTQIRKLSSLRISLLQWQAEDKYYQSTAFVSTANPSGRVTDLCVKMLFPLLRKLENDAMLSSDVQWSGSLEVTFLELIGLHKWLWKTTQDAEGDAGFLLYLWIRAKASMLHLVEEAKLESHRPRVLHVIQVMDLSLCGGRTSLVKPFLWKHGGHPIIPGSLEALAHQEELFAASEKIWPGGRKSNLTLGFDSGVWHLMLQALSIVSSTRGPTEVQAPREILQVVSTMMKDEEYKIHTAGDCELIPFTNNEGGKFLKAFCCRGCASLQRFSKELLRWPSAEELVLQAYPWLNHVILLLNWALLSDVSTMIADFTYDEDQSRLINELRKRKEEFQHVLSFSMRTSPRSPAAFVAHQQVLWILDADLSAGAASLKDIVHDMTFQWHSAVWEDEKLSARRLFQAVETPLFSRFIGTPVEAKDYHARVEQLRTFLVQAWFSGRHKVGDLLEADLRRASATLQQVVYAHKKLLHNMEGGFQALKSLHCQFFKCSLEVSMAHINKLRHLFEQSQNQEIARVLLGIVLPCFELLYLTSWAMISYHDALSSLGRVWFSIGKARLELLLLGYAVDPVAKYNYKRVQLLQKLEDLELQIQVRKESCALVGAGGGAGSLMCEREQVKEELRLIETKVVPRPSPSQFQAFCHFVDDFMQFFGSSARLDALVDSLTEAASSKALAEVASWQENASAIIAQLSSRFKSYKDLVQPVQLALYELKYGLSLIAGHSYNELDVAERSVCALMRFPTGLASSNDLATQRVERLLEKVSSTRPPSAEPTYNELQLKVVVLRTALATFFINYAYSGILPPAGLKLLNGILSSFVNIWKQMQANREAKEEENKQQIRFTSHQLETEAEDEETAFRKLFPSYWSLEASTSDESHEALVAAEDDKNFGATKHRSVEADEDLLDDVVDIYKSIFLSQQTGVRADFRLKSFVLGYDVGAELLKGTNISLAVDRVETEVFPAHLLRLALEHQSFSTPAGDGFNIYKDANPLELSRMLGPLSALLKRIAALLEEWPEHPVLLQIIQFSKSLISIPLKSPIMKALAGLELVLLKAQIWEQNASKMVTLGDELKSISQLILRWRKLELLSWPTLLQATRKRHERNGEKLWFELYDQLHRVEDLDTIFGLTELFLVNAPLGEFHVRLRLIWGFHREFHANSNEAPNSMDSNMSSVLYNVYQYYQRCLPIVEEALSSGSAPIEKELSDFARLSKWEDYNYYSLTSSIDKSHRKLHKFIRKYDEHLKCATSLFLGKASKELQPVTHDVENLSITSASETQGKIGTKWEEFCKLGFQATGNTATVKKIFKTAHVMTELLSTCIFSKHGFEMRYDGAEALESFVTAVITRSIELRDEKKSIALKKKALVDLRKGLKELGLSHRKADVPLDMRTAKRWFREPVCELEDLRGLNEVEQLLMQNGKDKWARAKSYYYDNIPLFQRLYASSLEYHKDLTLSEVERFTQYMEHLLSLQQKHRRKICEFVSSLAAISSLNLQFKMIDSVIPAQQRTLRESLWQQKSLLDPLCQASAEVELFLISVGQADGRSLGPEASKLLNGLTSYFEKLRCCKSRLDGLLLPYTSSQNQHPLVVTDQMLAMLITNIKELRQLDRYISQVMFDNRFADGAAARLLKPLQDLLQKGFELPQFVKNTADSSESILAQMAQETDSIITDIRLAGQKLAATAQTPELSQKTLQQSEFFLGELLASLRLNVIYNSFVQSVTRMVGLLEQGQDDMLGKEFANVLKSLAVLLDMVQAAAMQVLSDYINMHKAAAKLGYVVSSILNELYRLGFCKPREESETDKSKLEDAEGTGMGEGEGTKDVSEQIEDENQLLSETETPALGSEQERTDKGIEMEQDFKGDMFDISEDESEQQEEGDQENQDEQLESKMGDQDDNGEIVDEKLWDKEDEGNVEEGTEKYEQGAPVQDTGDDELELRGKELNEGEDAAEDKEQKRQPENGDKQRKPEAGEDAQQDAEQEGDKDGLDMEDAFEDPSGLKPTPEDEVVTEEDKTLEAEAEAEADEGTAKDGDGEGMRTDEDAEFPDKMELEEEDSKGMGDTADQEVPAEADAEAEPVGNEQKEEAKEPVSEANREKQTKQGELEGDNGQEMVADVPEQQNLGVRSEFTYGITTQESQADPSSKQSQSHASAMEAEPDVGTNNYASRSSVSQAPEQDHFNKLDPNPFRSLGDALKEWKELARMIEDEQKSAANQEADIQDEEADAYKYVSAGEKSTAQTQGAATDKQVNESERLDKLLQENEDEVAVSDDPMNLDKPALEDSQMPELEMRERRRHQQQINRTVSDRGEVADAEGLQDMDENDNLGAQDGSLISLKADQDVDVAQDEAEAARIREELKVELGTNAKDLERSRSIWSKYERLTGRLSQELAEQLRLILEPTLAARFQGDYKSGKRLNLKKIIPFVASGFKSDKIWLRRTKANKRQYQVVLALDDSRSMSESHCGYLALEALITLCRAMTQLEVGEMAVASFGKKGNFRLLHNFDQPFTSEAGVKMISEFSFRQDNTISDEPMVDMLQNLTTMLDSVSVRGGRGDLQQLVLIIADGRFHEKESLRRCVRDALSRRQLLAFLVLDNPRESLVNMKTVSFPKAGGAPCFSSYLDTFPFPYYILLKDVDELPRTLADLLRQWFELMQQSSR